MQKSLLEVLRLKKQAIKDAETFIVEENEKHKAKIACSEARIQKEKREIDYLKCLIVSVNLETLVEEVANEWNVDLKDVATHVITDFCLPGEKTLEDMITYIENQQKIFKITLIVEDLTNPLRVMFFENEVNMNMPLKNGCQLKNCLRVEKKQNAFGKEETSLVCGSHKNLVFKYMAGHLLNPITSEPDGIACQLVFNAIEKDNANKTEENV